MENKNFKILHVGHGKKKMSNICNKYLYSQGLNFIRPFDESYRKINEKNLEEIKELIPNYFGKKNYIYNKSGTWRPDSRC